MSPHEDPGTTQAPRPCPECKGSGRGSSGVECWACEGYGSMSRGQANHYYGEGGVNDAEEDRAALERMAEEGEAQRAHEAAEADEERAAEADEEGGP